jgi:hypothetical protein
MNQLQQHLEQLSLSGPIEPFLVFADWLQANGDPWGELISASCGQRGVPHVLARLGPSVCFLQGMAGGHVWWERGFVAGLAWDVMLDARSFAVELPRLLALPACHFLPDVRLGGLRDEHVPAVESVASRLESLRFFQFVQHEFSRVVEETLRQRFPRASFTERLDVLPLMPVG